MEVDIRKHEPVRQAVHAGIAALRVQARQIWGDTRHTLPEIALRIMVGVGDIARLARDSGSDSDSHSPVPAHWRIDRSELKKELGNVIFSTIRWIDDLGFDPLECIDLAIEAQEKFAKSGRPR